MCRVQSWQKLKYLVESETEQKQFHTRKYFLSVLSNSGVPVWHLKSLDGSEDSHNASFSLGLLASNTIAHKSYLAKVLTNLQVRWNKINIQGPSAKILLLLFPVRSTSIYSNSFWTFVWYRFFQFCMNFYLHGVLHCKCLLTNDRQTNV